MTNATSASEKGIGVGLDPTIDFIAGIISGVAGLVVGHPFDTVKVRLQSSATTGKYHSTIHAFLTIIREEHLVGLYKGITSPLITGGLVNGLLFASYRFFLKVQNGADDVIPTLTQVLLAGICAGVVSSLVLLLLVYTTPLPYYIDRLVTTPVELIKIRQQDQLTSTSTSQIALQVFKESGVPGLYRGAIATILRETNCGPYFVVYEAISRYFSVNNTKELPWYTLMLAGGAAGVGRYHSWYQSTQRQDAYMPAQWPGRLHSHLT
ncbi:hypothetical protein AX15_000788 [Amanita polypyramis BW_CC]|nr:hypothetical protein AX15_000788 [Amanita polypyramis BW_CC]